MPFWRPFKISCGSCGKSGFPRYKGRAQKSPRKGIAVTLLDRLDPCSQCSKKQHLDLSNSDRPLINTVRSQLIGAGFLTKDGQVIDPPPAGVDPIEVVDHGLPPLQPPTAAADEVDNWAEDYERSLTLADSEDGRDDCDDSDAIMFGDDDVDW